MARLSRALSAHRCSTGTVPSRPASALTGVPSMLLPTTNPSESRCCALSAWTLHRPSPGCPQQVSLRLVVLKRFGGRGGRLLRSVRLTQNLRQVNKAVRDRVGVAGASCDEHRLPSQLESFLHPPSACVDVRSSTPPHRLRQVIIR